ncbi:MAG TPA: hypothetical protein VLT59_06310, partial [Steroidobacteraceae bacterium]|nr:hypothetical protein [Steroidobacteraceae bacterium]
MLIDLAIDGRPVITPDRNESAGRASVWLGPRPAATPQAESLDVRVHRRLEDGIPGRLETRILLSVAGPPREVTLGPILPADFSVLGIASALPARLDREHRLHLQLQRGNWQVTVHARAPGVVDAFELPVPAEPWPPRETLSFTPRDALRIVTIEGASPTDPGQAGVPPDWQGQSAYVLSPGEGLRLVERSRGLAGDAGTRLELQRELWLGFDHAGWLARDRLTGELSGRWRRGMTAPRQLESVTTDGRHLSVTRGDNGDNGETGFELRSARVDVDALASLPMAASELPASGWQHVLDAAVTQLNLPPGHRLIAAFGVAESRGDWLGRWTLLDIFVVLLVTVAAFRLLGPVGAAVSLPALALGYHEPLAPTWVWVNVVLAVALVRALPTGRLRQWASVWRAVSFVLLLLVLVPFAFVQLRLALYPQLSEPAFAAFAPIGAQAPRSERPVMEDEASKAYEAAMTSALEARDAAGLAQAAPDAAPAPSPPTAIEYLPGTVAQTGPARPQWRYQQYWLEFAAPVEPGQIVRLVIAPPWAVSTLRVLAVAFAVVFLLLLAQGVVAPPARRAAAATTGAAVAFVAFALMLGLPASSAQAQAAIPTTELLRELERRLLEPPSCAPECASLAAAYVDVGATEAEITLDVHATAPTAFPMPRLGNPLAYSQATERGGSAVPVVADQGGQAWALVEPGIRRIELVVPIGDATQFQLRFPRVPKRVEARAPGWSVDGIAAGRLIGDTVSLQREALVDGGERPAREGASAPIAPFVIVERRLLLDLDWT